MTINFLKKLKLYNPSYYIFESVLNESIKSNINSYTEKFDNKHYIDKYLNELKNEYEEEE